MAKSGVPPLPVVKDFDVLEYAQSCLFSGLIAVEVDQFCFQRMEEAFGDRVVVTTACGAHACSKAVLLEKLLEFSAGILTATV